MGIPSTVSEGKTLSVIGLGCVTFGRETDPVISFAIMDYARAHGIHFFDTAQDYGGGSSERIVGKWLSSRKAFDSVIATKIQPPYDSKSMVDRVDQSLYNLGVETIDLLYLHQWDPSIENPGSLRILQDLQNAGKIRSVGASNFNSAQLSKVIQLQTIEGLDLLSSVQNNNNYAVSDIDEDLIQLCQRHAIALVTYSPLGAGFLTGKYQNGVDEDTRFDRIKGHQEIYFTKRGWQKLGCLQRIAASSGYSPSFLALAWAFRQPAITSVLVGCRNLAQLQTALAASTFYNPGIFLEMGRTLTD